VFDDVRARYALRCFLYGVAGFCVSIQASSTGSDLEPTEWRNAVIAGVLAALGYAGVGAASTVVEPSIGNKREG
jgi:hypothetical protein